MLVLNTELIFHKNVRILLNDYLDQKIGENLLAHIKWMFLLWYKVRDGTLSWKSFQLAMKFTQNSIENPSSRRNKEHS